MRLILAFAALLAAAPPAAAQELRLVDLTPKFDEVAMATQGMDGRDRIAAFESAMAGVGDGFYVRKRNPEGYARRVLNSLAIYPLRRDGILAVGKEFSALMAPAKASFEAAFGPVHSEQPVYLLHSLGEMDGGTRDNLDSGKTTLIFGADVIAQFHAGNDMTPFFHHEMFHVYHEKPFGECEPTWCSLWEEGLATYVAQQLNPEAGDAALLLDIPAPIRPAVDKDRAAAICATVPLLSSTDEKDYSKLFYGNAHLPGLPARMGYYIGYLVAADLGKTRSLKQLAALKPAEVKPLLDASLAGMARCPGKS